MPVSESPHILLRRYQFLQVIYGKAKNEVKECESLVLLGEVAISGLRPDNFDSVQVSLENSSSMQAVEDLTTCLAKSCLRIQGIVFLILWESIVKWIYIQVHR